LFYIDKNKLRWWKSLKSSEQSFPEKGKPIPPCQAACPIYQDVRGYIGAAVKKEFDKAIEIIKETNPLPFICATICAHPCENECRRKNADEALSIRSLKRAALDFGNMIKKGPSTLKGEKVAVIGSGPGGLTAAHDLALLGYKVTVMEKESILGGALANFVPLYRLPRELINRDIDGIRALGVKFETDLALGRDIKIADLKSQGYQAILISTGLPISRNLSLPGFDMNNVWLALPFLRDINLNGRRIDNGKSVIVIGGGNVAIDVARSALRAGAIKVKLVCLESFEEMPAFPWEIQEAEEEGVEINCSWGPKCIKAKEGTACALETVAVMSVFDEKGCFNPTFCEDKLSVIEGDIVIIAIGQTSDLSFLNGNNIKLAQKGKIIFDPISLVTPEAGIFACGEVISGPGMAVEAMASGRQAALSIHHYIQGIPLTDLREPESLEQLDEEVISSIKRQARQSMPLLDVKKRIKNFDYIEVGYTQEMAVCEARRCLSCGAGARRVEEKCIDCLTCVRVCPYDVPIVTPAPENCVEIREDQCQACGICVVECPARAIEFNSSCFEDMDRELEGAFAQRDPLDVDSAIALFYCYYDTGAMLGLAPILKKELQSKVALLKVPCVAKLGVSFFLKTFEMGVNGLLIMECKDTDCKYSHAALWLKRRIEITSEILKELWPDQELIKMISISGDGFQELKREIDTFAQEIKN
jgi:NADPH-dependent glutamate synthase beta subunit-like oxidoreductase/coenzyme F420-reducing hydrogenase delta subunit